MFKLIRGRRLSKMKVYKNIKTTALCAVMGIGFFSAATTNVYAADKPPSLLESVRAAVAQPGASGAAATTPTTNATTSVAVSGGSVAIAQPGVGTVNVNTATPPSRAPEMTDGIQVSGAAPAMSAAQQAEAEQLLLQQQAEEAAAKAAQDRAKQEEEYNRKSFKKASEGLLPLSPDQVRSFMNKLENTQEAALPPHDGTPRGEVKVVGLSLDPSGEPPQINLAAGYVTTIDIIDQTGEPWPILDVSVGGNFEVTPTQAGSHVVRIVPLTRFGSGNLSILLKDLSTPIIFRLAAGGPTFHMRFDARVPQIGPMAKTPLIRYKRQGPVAGDQVLSMLLENAPPPEAKRLRVGGVDARTKAWQIGDKAYVRTPLSLLSPAWNASVSSSDGMTVYEIGSAPVLLMSDNGAMIRARLLRDDSHDR